MKARSAPRLAYTGIFILLSILKVSASTLYVDLNSTNPTAPYTNWATASLDIQSAIDVSTDGDEVIGVLSGRIGQKSQFDAKRPVQSYSRSPGVRWSGALSLCHRTIGL